MRWVCSGPCGRFRIISILAVCLIAGLARAQTVTKLNNETPDIQDTATTSTDGRLGLGSDGTGDDVGLYAGNVLKDDDGTYKMWYGGSDGSFVRTFLATSPDGLTWTKYTNGIPDDSNTTGTAGRIPRGTGAGRGDITNAYSPWVIKDGGLYKAWYTGSDGKTNRIYHATSTDGLTWTKYSNSIPVRSNTGGDAGRIPAGTSGGDAAGTLYPCVIKDGAEYKMWYTGYDGTKYRIYHATSPDGLAWTKYANSVPDPSNTVGTLGRVPVGTSGGDTAHVIAPSVVRTRTGYRMWYGGHDSSKYRVYHATSSNGLDWIKTSNAVPSPTNTTTTAGRIALGVGARGDTNYVFRATPLLEDGAPYRLWYMGQDGTSWRIYYATMERDSPAITNLGPINVTASTADLTGQLGLNEADPARVQCFWGRSNGGTDISAWATNVDFGVRTGSVAVFTNSLSGLPAGTRYYFCFYATNAQGAFWATPAGSFSTPGAPSVSNAGGATNVTSTAATLRGDVTGGNPQPVVYIYWGATNQGTVKTLWEHEELIGVASNWEFSVTVPVTHSQTYYYRCYASNSYDEAWSPVTNFTTPGGVIRRWSGSGNWMSDINWIPAGPLGPHDDAIVETGGNVLLTNEVTVGSVTMMGGTLTFAGTNTILRATDIAVSGTVTHLPNTATNAPWTMDNRIWIVCSNLTVWGAINATTQGYQGVVNAAGYGPGRATYTGGVPAYGAGGGHGGAGGSSLLYLSKQGIGGSTYGSVTEPDLPGSSGGGSYASLLASGAGGGAIRIEATGTVRVNGTITADGGNAGVSDRPWTGPGSGGSIYVRCHRFEGDAGGRLSARAGSSGGSCGGGGGGRIAVHFDEADPVARVAFNANLSSGLYTGTVGSIYLSDSRVLNSAAAGCYGLVYGPTNWMSESLSVSNSYLLFQDPGFEMSVSNALQVGPNATLAFNISNRTVTIGGLTVATNSSLTFTAGPTNATGVYTNCGARLVITGDVTIAAGGTLKTYADLVTGGAIPITLRNLDIAQGGTLASPGGFDGGASGGANNGRGPGGGKGAAGTTYTGGGGYGGRGGTGASGSTYYGPTNGNPARPVCCGSGGGGNTGNHGGRGGGLVWIETSGRITINGTVSANGPDNVEADGLGTLGGGSGGGIYLYADEILGDTGLITAEGADSSWGYGPGGGGRIALYARTDSFAGSFSVMNGYSRNPPSANAYSAETGSIVRATLPGLVTLTVAGSPAEHGTSTPFAYGTHGVMTDSILTNSVNSPADVTDGVRYACLGWTFRETASGTAISDGLATQAVFTITTNSTLTWLWTNQYQLALAAACNGSLDQDRSGWYTQGDSVTVTVTAASGYHFSQWSGTVPPADLTNTPLVLLMDRARTVQANFASNTPETKVWSGSGNWFTDFSNWSPAGAPGAADAATVNAGTVTLTTATTFNSLTLQGRVIVAGNPYPAPLAVNGALAITGSTARLELSNAFLTVGGGLELAGGADMDVCAVSTNATGAEYGALVSVGGDMVLGSNSWVYPYSDLTNGGSPKFTARSLSVAQGGGFDASSKGYYGGGRYPLVPSGWQGLKGGGPGGGGPNTIQGFAGGGGYGGLGGAGAYNGLSSQGAIYGVSNRPVQCGSGGGGTASASGGRGGGLIWIETADRITLNGTLDANGQTTYGGLNAGAGSGGGIYLRGSSLRGGTTAVIRANGGYASWASGAGAGGRIAIFAASGYAFRGTVSATYGLTTDGSSYRDYSVEPGTIVYMVPGGTMFLTR